jgi:hypothetical protein
MPNRILGNDADESYGELHHECTNWEEVDFDEDVEEYFRCGYLISIVIIIRSYSCPLLGNV